jgi:hypothetical protein
MNAITWQQRRQRQVPMRQQQEPKLPPQQEPKLPLQQVLLQEQALRLLLFCRKRTKQQQR